MVGVTAQVDVDVEPQLLRVQGAGQVLDQGDDPSGHRPFCQSLIHHILAPLILQEVGCDQQSPQMAVLHRLAKLRGRGATWTVVPVLQETPEAMGRSLQEGDKASGLLTVTGHQAVAHEHIILATPSLQ